MGLLDRFRSRRAHGLAGVTGSPPTGIRVGTDDGFRAVVDERGTVAVAGRDHVVEWWIGGDDRWYAPATEAAVRQVRPGDAPVVETRMRVHGADVVATTWAGQADGSQGPAVVVELANETAVPVAVAVAVRAAPGGRIRRLAVDGRRLVADDEVAAVVDRAPGRHALVDASGDLWDEVVGGRATVEPPAPVHCRSGLAAGALVVPLPHRAALRVAVPGGDLAGDPAAVFPPVERVVAGWASRLDRAATVDVPDGDGSRPLLADLLLADPEPAGVLELARWGLPSEALGRLDGLGGRSLALGLVVAAADDDPDDLAALAELFAAADEARAAGDARARARTAVRGVDDDPADPDGRPAGRLRALARTVVRPSADGLDLLPVAPDAWRGRPVEVHGLATPSGRLGFAVRWHGERPALLWELQRHPVPDEGPDRDAVLRIPGLDPSFATTEASGEVLLAAPADPRPPDR